MTAATDSRRARLRVGLGAGVVLVLVALGVAVVVAALAPRGGAQTVAPAAPTATAAASGAAILVHLLGAVERPGLYELPEGARAVDAVAAAGGFLDTADQTQLNLARLVSDGEQIYVPTLGEAPPVAAGEGTVAGKVNLNTADAAALETLPQVGPALASRIIEWREANGRFTAVEDLLSVTGIGDKTFDGLKDRVTV